MINRVLIRIKTVQLLYSYLLVEKPFMLESQPLSPTKEKRFAYSLYLDLNYLMIKIADNIKGLHSSYPLKRSRYIQKIESLDQMKVMAAHYSEGSFPFEPLIEELSKNVSQSLLYREYIKESTEEAVKDKFWQNVFYSIILPNEALNRLMEKREAYSLSGIDRMKTMMDDTFRQFYTIGEGLSEALNTLSLSMNKARELYLRLLALPVELTSLRMKQLETNRKKILASAEDLNPNMKFVDNILPAKIASDPIFESSVEENKISWIAEDKELLEHLLSAIFESELYKKYVSEDSSSHENDIFFWREIFNEIILNDENFLEYLENKSVFWNDDLEITMTFIQKTFKNYEKIEQGISAVLPMYKDVEDANFGAELFRYVIKDKDYYKILIEKGLSGDKWDADRLAFMDVVIMMTALAEILHYPKIPLTVSINEYIEIAKSYSSEKSGSFVHGLLAKIIARLKEEGDLAK